MMPAAQGRPGSALFARREGLARRGLAAGFRGLLPVAIALLFALPARGEIQLGVSAGRMSVDVAARSAPWNLALSLAHPIDTRLANLWLLAEINRTVSRGETRDGEDLEFESDGLFVVLKTNRSLYFSLRGGVVEERIGRGDTSSTEQGFAYGGGIGGIIGRARFTIEFTRYDGNADFLSLGLEF